MSPTTYVQPTLDELLTDRRRPLRDVTFVVFDLETTGGSPKDSEITEIGAVKVRGGERLGEFATLVNPGTGIPPYITVLTGITNAMVSEAPRIQAVLPGFLEFAAGAVLVAHNAPFDIGFMKAACARHGHHWPGFRVVDTVRLARRLVTRDEVPSHKLGALARFFRSATQPNHRALVDARATVDVLDGLISRLGGHKVFTLDELIEFARAVSAVQRRKRHLAAGVPATPGVYLFRDRSDRVLYVGTSGNLAQRVRNYFTAAESRSRVKEMLAAAERVETVPCAHALEAQIRELRLIAAHAPPYNRRSKYPERVWWLKLTAEAYPRLSLVRELRDDGADYLGPFASRKSAELAAAGVHDAVPLRQCTPRLSPRRPSASCALAELGRCPAPCELRISVEQYGRLATTVAEGFSGDPGPLLTALLRRIDGLAAGERFEDAARVRSRLVALLRAAVRMQRLAGLGRIGQLVAARRAAVGGWEISVVRHGRLAAAGTSPPRAHPQPTIDVLLASAETVIPGPGPMPAALAEETERVIDWLELPDTRLVSLDVTWASPIASAARWRGLLRRAELASRHPLVQMDVRN